jgi:hypothetical protein
MHRPKSNHPVRFVRYRVPEGGSLLMQPVASRREADLARLIGEIEAWLFERATRRAMRRTRRLRRRRRRLGLVRS